MYVGNTKWSGKEGDIIQNNLEANPTSPIIVLFFCSIG